MREIKGILRTLVLLLLIVYATSWSWGNNDSYQNVEYLNINAPAEAIDALKKFQQALVDQDGETARQLKWDGRFVVLEGEEHDWCLNYRILTLGPSPQAVGHSEYPNQSVLEGDLSAWIEIQYNTPKWNNPRGYMHTVLTKRTGSWKIFAGEVGTNYADKRIYYLP